MSAPQTRSLSAYRSRGWQLQPYTLTTAQTYLWGILFALPFLLLAGGLYRAFLLEHALLLDHTGLILLAVLVVSLPLHEALHGVGWRLAGGLSQGEVSFVLRHGLPMCSCRAVLPTRAYLVGVLLPFVVLGGGSLAAMVLWPGTVTVLAALTNLLLPGADLAIAFSVLRSGAALVADTPDQAGFVALTRDAQSTEAA